MCSLGGVGGSGDTVGRKSIVLYALLTWGLWGWVEELTFPGGVNLHKLWSGGA